MNLFIKNANKYFDEAYGIDEGHVNKDDSLGKWCDDHNRQDIKADFEENNPDVDIYNVSIKERRYKYNFTCPECKKVKPMKLVWLSNNTKYNARFVKDSSEPNLTCWDCKKNMSLGAWCDKYDTDNSVRNDFESNNHGIDIYQVSIKDSRNGYNFTCPKCKKVKLMRLSNGAHETRTYRFSEFGDKNLICGNCQVEQAAKKGRITRHEHAKKLSDWAKENPLRGNLLRKEWDGEKNEKIMLFTGEPCTFDTITYGTQTKVWWKCLLNPEHQWMASVTQRTRLHAPSNCPLCAKERQTSWAQEVVNHYINEVLKINGLPTVNSSRGELGFGRELDIFIPKEISQHFGWDMDLAIEYNGEYFHKQEEVAIKDKWKATRCKSLNIKLIIIDALQDNYDLDGEEEVKVGLDLDSENTGHYSYLFSNNSDLEKIIKDILHKYFKTDNIAVDFNKDKDALDSLIIIAPVKKSFGYKHFDKLIDWDEENNPNPFTLPASGKRGKQRFYANFKCHKCGQQYIHDLSKDIDLIHCPIEKYALISKINDKNMPIKINCVNADDKLITVFNDSRFAAKWLSNDVNTIRSISAKLSRACWLNNGSGIFTYIREEDGKTYKFQYDTDSYNKFIEQLNAHIEWTEADEEKSQQELKTKWKDVMDILLAKGNDE